MWQEVPCVRCCYENILLLHQIWICHPRFHRFLLSTDIRNNNYQGHTSFWNIIHRKYCFWPGSQSRGASGFPPRFAAFLTMGREGRQDSEHAVIKASLVARFKTTWISSRYKPERSLYHDYLLFTSSLINGGCLKQAPPASTEGREQKNSLSSFIAAALIWQALNPRTLLAFQGESSQKIDAYVSSKLPVFTTIVGFKYLEKRFDLWGMAALAAQKFIHPQEHIYQMKWVSKDHSLELIYRYTSRHRDTSFNDIILLGQEHFLLLQTRSGHFYFVCQKESFALHAPSLGNRVSWKYCQEHIIFATGAMVGEWCASLVLIGVHKHICSHQAEIQAEVSSAGVTCPPPGQSSPMPPLRLHALPSRGALSNRPQGRCKSALFGYDNFFHSPRDPKPHGVPRGSAPQQTPLLRQQSEHTELMWSKAWRWRDRREFVEGKGALHNIPHPRQHSQHSMGKNEVARFYFSYVTFFPSVRKGNFAALAFSPPNWVCGTNFELLTQTNTQCFQWDFCPSYDCRIWSLLHMKWGFGKVVFTHRLTSPLFVEEVAKSPSYSDASSKLFF